MLGIYRVAAQVVASRAVLSSTELVITTTTTTTIIIIIIMQAFDGPWPICEIPQSYTQSVGLPCRGISPSQGIHQPAGQHKQRTPLSGDQPVTRNAPTRRTTQTEDSPVGGSARHKESTYPQDNTNRTNTNIHEEWRLLGCYAVWLL
jgi:hypothetical protein